MFTIRNRQREQLATAGSLVDAFYVVRSTAALTFVEHEGRYVQASPRDTYRSFCRALWAANIEALATFGVTELGLQLADEYGLGIGLNRYDALGIVKRWRPVGRAERVAAAIERVATMPIFGFPLIAWVLLAALVCPVIWPSMVVL